MSQSDQVADAAAGGLVQQPALPSAPHDLHVPQTLINEYVHPFLPTESLASAAMDFQVTGDGTMTPGTANVMQMLWSNMNSGNANPLSQASNRMDVPNMTEPQLATAASIVPLLYPTPTAPLPASAPTVLRMESDNQLLRSSALASADPVSIAYASYPQFAPNSVPQVFLPGSFHQMAPTANVLFPGMRVPPAPPPHMIPAIPPPNIQGIYSSTGFDLLSLLSRIANRPNARVDIGPVDLGCTLVVSSARTTDFPVVYASESFCRLTGYPLKEILGRNCRFLQAPDGQVTAGSRRRYTDNYAVYNMKASVTAGEEVQLSIVNYKKNGKPFLNLITIIPIHAQDGSGEVEFFVGLQVDMVEQPQAILNRLQDGSYSVNYGYSKQPQNIVPRSNCQIGASRPDSIFSINAPFPITPKLRDFLIASNLVGAAELDTPEKFVESTCRALLAESPDFVHVITLKGQLMYVCQAITRILGYTPEELIGSSLDAICHPTDLPPVLREIRDAGAPAPDPAMRSSFNGRADFPTRVYTGSTDLIGVLYRAKRKDGTWIWVEAKGKVIMEPGRSRRCAVLAGRVRTVPRIPLAVVLSAGGYRMDEFWSKLSPEGIFLYVGMRCTPLLGVRPETLQGTSLYQYARLDRVTGITRALTLVSEEHRVVRIRHQLLDHRGIEMDMESIVFPEFFGVDDQRVYNVHESVVMRSRVLGPMNRRPALMTADMSPDDVEMCADSDSAHKALAVLNISTNPYPNDGTANEATVEDWFGLPSLEESSTWYLDMHKLELENCRLKLELQDLEGQRKAWEAQQLATMLMERKRRQQAESTGAEGSATDMRSCSLCGKMQSPEWRRGPEGPKTLCNSCGLSTSTCVACHLPDRCIEYSKAVRDGTSWMLMQSIRSNLQ